MANDILDITTIRHDHSEVERASESRFRNMFEFRQIAANSSANGIVTPQ